MAEQQAKEIMDEVIEDVTLDRFLDRNPSTLKYPEDYKDLVKVLRADRARFIQGEKDKKEKKELGHE